MQTSTQKMNLNDIQCPWPADGVDLSITELSEMEKTWLAHQIVSKVQTPRALANRYNLKPDTLRRYASRLRAQRPMRKFAGRPAAVDRKGFSELCQKFRENPTLNKVDFDKEINSKCLPTLDRSFSYEATNLSVEGLSRRSLRRYEIRVKLVNSLNAQSNEC